MHKISRKEEITVFKMANILRVAECTSLQCHRLLISLILLNIVQSFKPLVVSMAPVIVFLGRKGLFFFLK